MRVLLPDLGAFLVQQREALGWKQAQAADIAMRRGIEVSYQALRGLEEGKTQNPEPQLLKEIAALYKVPYEELVRRFVSERYGIAFGEVASIPHTSREHVADAARVRELEHRAEQYEETLGELSTIAEKLVKLATRGAEDRAPARRAAVRGRRHRTAG